MIKFNDKLKESQKAEMCSWLLKLLSRGMETKIKNKNQPRKK